MPHPHAAFTSAAYRLEELPPDRGREVAFSGRSNAGKSSAINALTHRKKLAFVSKTPGRTQTINFFDVGRERRWVDLPGYGYAKVAKQERDHWGQLISAYLMNRNSLIGLILIADSRLGLTPLDGQLIEWFAPTGKPLHVLLTKSDKLSQRAAAQSLSGAQNTLATQYSRFPQCTAQLFSAHNHRGVAQANSLLAQWLA